MLRNRGGGERRRAFSAEGGIRSKGGGGGVADGPLRLLGARGVAAVVLQGAGCPIRRASQILCSETSETANLPAASSDP